MQIDIKSKIIVSDMFEIVLNVDPEWKLAFRDIEAFAPLNIAFFQELQTSFQSCQAIPWSSLQDLFANEILNAQHVEKELILRCLNQNIQQYWYGTISIHSYWLLDFILLIEPHDWELDLPY